MVDATGLASGATASTGNVGIGTSNPQTQLHVYSTSPDIRLEQAGGALLDISIGSSIDFRRQSTVVPFTFTQGSSEVFRIDTVGNVGIANASPGALLDIGSAGATLGTLRLEGNTSGYVQLQSAAAAGSWTMTLPTSGGSNGYVLQTNGAGVTSWVPATSGSSGITLGTAASATNPQRSGQIGTGLFSANSSQVSIADNGTDIMDVNTTGPNIHGTITQGVYSIGYQINGNNAIWQDDGNFNMAVGNTSLPTNVDQTGGGFNGTRLSAVGYQALNANTTGTENTALGTFALGSNTTGFGDTAIGSLSLENNTTGQFNIGVGHASLLNNTTGSYNIGIGALSLDANTTGNDNVAVGYFSLFHNTTGVNNVAVGMLTLVTNTTGVNNTVVGLQAGYDITTGSHNLILGDYTTGVGVTSGSNNIMIGQDVRPPSQTASNQLNIGNLIYATGLASGATASTGNVGIGTSAPAAVFDVEGGSGDTILAGNSLGSNGNAAIHGISTGSAAGVRGEAGSSGFAGVYGIANSSTNYGVRAFNGGGGLALYVSGLAYFNNSVGIGSTSPIVSLDIGQKSDAIALPSGLVAARPAGANGELRYSQTDNALEAYVNGAWTDLLTSGGTSSTITLGTSATATNPRRSGEAGTGLFSAASGTVSIAGTGTDYADFSSAGLALPVGTETLRIGGNNAVWQDATNFNVAVGPTAFPTTVSQAGGGTHGQSNIAIGFQALNTNTTGANNTAIGEAALSTNTTGASNTAVGQVALASNTTGANNTAIGEAALSANTTGANNTAMGQAALASNTTGANNTAVGQVALVNNTTGANNTAVGAASLLDNTTGTNNAAVGQGALLNNTTGGYNTAVGAGALVANTTGASNTAVGQAALVANTTGSSNTAIGEYALGISTSGGNNTAIGFNVGSATLTTGSGNILIGATNAVDTPTSSTSNFLNIGNTIFATGVGTGTLSSPAGNVGIGTTSPGSKLEINAGANSVIGIGQANNTNYNAILLNGSSNIVGDIGLQGGATGDSILYVDSNGSSGSILFRTNAGNRMVINPSGNIGIGSNTPIVSLDIGQKSDAIALPSGLVAARPAGANGELRYSQTDNALEAYVNGAWTDLLTSGGTSSTITLGTSATATNPRRTGQAGTGLFSASSSTVSVAVDVSGTGTDVMDIGTQGPNVLGVITAGSYSFGYKLNGHNAVWEDGSSQNTAVGFTNFPTAVTQAGGGLNGLANLAVGYVALNANTIGYRNTGLGGWALNANTTGYQNAAVGSFSLFFNRKGYQNTAVGDAAMSSNTTGIQNTVLGQTALSHNTTGSNNTVLGYAVASTTLQTGVDNILLGVDNTTDTYAAATSTAIGIGQGVKPGTGDVGIGYQALHVTAGDNLANTAIGFSALAGNTTGGGNTAVGSSALTANTTGINNTAIGYQALFVNTTGIANVAVGQQALSFSNTGIQNTAVGEGALGQVHGGSSNSALGYVAGGNVKGGNNTAVGNHAMYGDTVFQPSGSFNTALGDSALYQMKSGAASNTMLGYQSGYTVTTGSSNTVVGVNVASTTLATGSNNILIGTSSAVDTPSSSTSNFLNIGNAIYATSLGSTPLIGIGSNAPLVSLDISQKSDAVALPSGLLAAIAPLARMASCVTARQTMLSKPMSMAHGPTF